MKTLKAKRRVPLEHQIANASLTPDGRELVVAGFGGVYAIDVASGKKARVYREAGGLEAWDARVTPDGARVVAVHGSFHLDVWETESAKLVFERPTDGVSMERVTLSADGHQALTSASNILRFWDLANGEARAVRRTPKPQMTGAVLMPNGKTAFHGGRDGYVRLFDGDREEEALAAKGKGAVNAVDVSADGKTLVSAGSGKAVLVWNASLELVGALEGASTVYSLSISPDGSRVVAADLESPVVWDVKSGEIVAKLEGEQVSAVRFSLDGRSIVTIGDDLARIHATP